MKIKEINNILNFKPMVKKEKFYSKIHNTKIFISLLLIVLLINNYFSTLNSSKYKEKLFYKKRVRYLKKIKIHYNESNLLIVQIKYYYINILK